MTGADPMAAKGPPQSMAAPPAQNMSAGAPQAAAPPMQPTPPPGPAPADMVLMQLLQGLQQLTAQAIAASPQSAPPQGAV